MFKQRELIKGITKAKSLKLFHKLKKTKSTVLKQMNGVSKYCMYLWKKLPKDMSDSAHDCGYAILKVLLENHL